MPIEVRQLETYRAVMENRSMTRAAEILGVSQPAVSVKLARLERELGFRLFDRDGGRLRPTPEGQTLYAEVKHALGMIDRVGIVAERIRSGEAGRLVVASHPSASISLLPDVIAEFGRASPRVAIKLVNRTSEEVRSFFEANMVDIGIAEGPVDLAGVERRRYAIDCVAILPRGHELADMDSVAPADLSCFPFVSMTPVRTIGHQIRAALGVASDVGSIVEAEYFSTICALVARGMGVGVVDYWSAQTFQHLGLEIRPLEPAIAYEVAVFFSGNRPRTAEAQLLLDMIDSRLVMHGRRVGG